MEGANQKMSPFTELAVNLSCLSTRSTVTPRRKVSWSGLGSRGTQNSNTEGFSSRCLTLGTPIFRKRKTDARRAFRSGSMILTSMNSVTDKEEVPSHSLHSPARKRSDVHLDSGSDAESHDSGFSGSFSDNVSLSCSSSLTPSSGPTVRSTVFADEETEDGFMHMFDLDDEEEDLNASGTLRSLFTKPIFRIGAKDEKPVESNRDPVPLVKKRTCRRLSMTSESPVGRAVSAARSPLYSLLKEGTPNRRKFELSGLSAKADTCHKSGDGADDVENNSKHSNSMDTIMTSPLSRSPFKRPDPPEHISPLFSKRQKRSPLSYSMKSQLTLAKSPVLQRCFSESETSIMRAVQKSDEQPDLIGDFSKPYILPLISGRHQDMKTVSPQTLVEMNDGEVITLRLAKLMKGVYNNSVVSYKVVDCRYPYEFSGGHIKGALNIYTREDVLSNLLSDAPQTSNKDQRDIMIFHCEFSSERAPNLCRFLRNQDRECNKDSYPQLCHPEVYLLEGGYKAFFENFKELCEPQQYTPMLHKDHEVDLRNFRAKSKSWSGGQTKKRGNLRIGRKFQVV